MVTKSIEGVAGDLNADLAALRQDVERLVTTVSALVQQQAHVAGDRAGQAVTAAGDRLAATAADAQARARAAGGDLKAGIEQNPLTSVLVAFGIGLSVGMLSRSRG